MPRNRRAFPHPRLTLDKNGDLLVCFGCGVWPTRESRLFGGRGPFLHRYPVIGSGAECKSAVFGLIGFDSQTVQYPILGGFMDKNKWLKVGGVLGIIAGSICLYLSGTGEAVVTAIVGGVFVLAGIIAGMFKSA